MDSFLCENEFSCAFYGPEKAIENQGSVYSVILLFQEACQTNVHVPDHRKVRSHFCR